MVGVERDERGDRGPAEVRCDHDLATREPVDDGSGDEAEQQHRGDLHCDDTADVDPRVRDLEHDDDERDGVERVSPSADRLGDEETPKPAVTQHVAGPAPWRTRTVGTHGDESRAKTATASPPRGNVCALRAWTRGRR